MNFYKNFKIKDTNADMVSDQQFIALATGTVVKNNKGDEYIKSDTIVFDKITKSIRSDSENDNRYPKLATNNIFAGTNIFNNGITVTGNITSDNINNSGDIFTNNLTASENIVAKNITASDNANLKNITSETIDNSGSLSTGNLTVSDNAEFNNLTLSGYVNAGGSITSGGTVQANALVVDGSSSVKDITCTSIVNSGTLTSDTLTSGDATLGNTTLTSASISNILSVSGDANLKNITSETIDNSSSLITTSFESRNNAKIGGNLNVTGTSTISNLTAEDVACTNQTIANNLSVTGVSTLNGNVVSKNITNSSSISTNTLTCSSTATILSVVPSSNNVGTIGSSAKYYSSAYIKNIYGDSFSGIATRSRLADLAEVYSSDKDYEPGTVLQVDEGSDSFLTCYNGGTLAGVVSENPGLIINSDAKGVKVALKGLVSVKCEGRIKKGQFCIAYNGGKVIGVDQSDMTLENLLRKVGVALSDSKNEKVLVKI